MAGHAVIHDEEPPRVDYDFKEIRFADDFHDLFHSVWSPRCGNRRLHLSRAWEYRWEPELRRMTLCRIGRHQLVKTWRRDADEMNRGVGPWRFAFTCYNCGHEPPLDRL